MRKVLNGILKCRSTNLQPASSPHQIIDEPTATMTSENNNPAIRETNQLTLSVVIVEDHIHMKEGVSPAPHSSKAATIMELSDTMTSCVESHKAMVKIGVDVVTVDMVDLTMCITSYTSSM